MQNSTRRIEDYALLSDTQTAALVARDGSIDWCCLPRFDSGACFAALLGGPDHGWWRVAPQDPDAQTSRRYRPGTLVLETEFRTREGTARVVDCMPIRRRDPDIVRVVEGVSGRVQMSMELCVRFDYGDAIPWLRPCDGGISAVAGDDALYLLSPVPARVDDDRVVRAEFTIGEGEQLGFVLEWHPSHEPAGATLHDPARAVDDTSGWWQDWSDRCSYDGVNRELVVRSLCTLKALTYAPTGGIVAAPTTSLPEELGGMRNWDYRYCWLRDATFTLYALLQGGYESEAVAWRDWLLRTVAGEPDQMQIMYGVAGERRLTEVELDWLPGYANSAPVRIGNAASRQFQLDVYGETMDVLHQARRAGVPPDDDSWALQRALLDFLEGAWREPDEGIWEVRGKRRHFTHSKVMCWAAFDRAAKAVESSDLEGPIERWCGLRDEIHTEVCREAWAAEIGAFTQSYGSAVLDASVLLMPLVGFLPASDPRMRSTVAAIDRELSDDGLVYRYAPGSPGDIDGLAGREGAFLACSFWLADNYALQGRYDAARQRLERLSEVCNDVGLLSEEYDVANGRMLGNFPQALSHVALVNTAQNVSRAAGPAEQRASTT